MFKEIKINKILTKRERIILCIALVIVVTSVGFNFLFEPLLIENDFLNKQIDLTKKKIIYYKRILSQKDSLQSKLNGMPYLIASNSQNVSLLATIENFSKDSQLRIIEIRPQDTQKVGLYKEISVEIKTEGVLEEYLKFIYRIESTFPILNIKRFQLNTKADSRLLEGSFYISQIVWD